MNAAERKCAKPRSAAASRHARVVTLTLWECRHCSAPITRKGKDSRWIHWPSLVERCGTMADPADEKPSDKIHVAPGYMEDMWKNVEMTRLRLGKA